MCFCDGSKLGTTEWAGTGLAVLTLDQERPRVVAYGPQPVALPVQRTVKRSELGAFLVWLQHSLPPVEAHPDHAAIPSSMAKGRQWCVQARRPHADVWRRIWDCWGDLGGFEASNVVLHVKAHRSQSATAKLQGAQRLAAIGNGHVDFFAKQGAGLDRGWARQWALDQAAERVKAAMAVIVETHQLVDGRWEDACSRAIWEAERIERRRKVLALKEAVAPFPLRLHGVQPCHNLLGVHGLEVRTVQEVDALPAGAERFCTGGLPGVQVVERVGRDASPGLVRARAPH